MIKMTSNVFQKVGDSYFPTLDFMQKYFLPLVDERWLAIMAKREMANHWTETAPFTDIFTMVAVQINQEQRTGDAKLMCLVPRVKCFWDAHLAFYLAARPELYKSHAHICRLILDGMKTVKMDPLSYINFTSDNLLYLFESADGLVQNKFLQDPAECLCEMLDVIQEVGQKLDKNSDKDFSKQKEFIRKSIHQEWPKSTDSEESSPEPVQTLSLDH